MNRMKLQIALSCLLILMGIQASWGGSAQDGAKTTSWPHYRGPDQLGVSAESGLPASFPADGLKLLWKSEKFGGEEFKADSHRQNGSAIIFSGKAYCQVRVGGGGKFEERLWCFNMQDGKKLWEAPLTQGLDGCANGTPVIEPSTKRIFATPSWGMQGNAGAPFNVMCLDAESGREIWSIDAKKLGFENPLGCATPLIHDELVVVVGKEKVVALNKQDGKLVWSWPEKLTPDPGKIPQRGSNPEAEEWYAKADPKAIMNTIVSSSPIAIKMGGQSAITVQAKRLADCCYGASTFALDAKTGKLLWTGEMRGSICSPIFANDTFLTLGYDMSHHYSHPLFMVAYKPQWTKDKDKQDQLSMTETWKTTTLYEGGGRYKMSSPMAVNGRAYWMSAAGGVVNLYSADMVTGKRHWTFNVGNTPGWALSSPVWAEGKIFWVDDPGKMYVINDKGGSAETILTQNICGQTGSTPAIAEGKLLIRDYVHGLSCYELKPSAPAKK